MPKGRKSDSSIIWIILACVGMFILAGCSKRENTGSTRSYSGDLESLSWEDVSTVYASGNAGVKSSITGSGNASPAPVLYLKGLYHLEQGAFAEALSCFGAIPPQDMPPAMLYIPYRIHAQIHPDGANPYWLPLYEASRSNQLSPLLQARVHTLAGEEMEGLEAYARSDPADWREFDLELFRRLNLHAGLRLDTQELLRAALRANRVPQSLKGELLKIIYPTSDNEDQATRLADVRTLLENNPDKAEQVVKASVPLLEAQKLFMSRSYGEIVRRFSEIDPVDQADRMVVIILLSAARENDKRNFTRWSQELYRRYPTTEMKQWIDSIRNQVESFQ